MESKNDKVYTKITYEKTSCFYCNEWLDSHTFKEHIIHCSQVIEKCPQLCGSHFQRKRIRAHLKECPKLKPATLTENTQSSSAEIEDCNERMTIIEQDITTLRTVLNDEIKQSLHLITDVSSLRRHNQITDEWTKKVADVLATLKRCINEESSARLNESKRIFDELHQLENQNKISRDWQISAIQRIENIEKLIQNGIHVQQGKNVKSIADDAKSLADERIIETIQTQITNLAYDANKVYSQLSEQLAKQEHFIKQIEHDKNTKLMLIEQQLNDITKDLQTKFISNTELNGKQAKLDYEVKSMKNIVCETEEKCEKLEKIVGNIDGAIHETAQGLVNLETHLIYQKKLNAIQNTKGHLIWKISDYSKKLAEAKKYNGSILSPVFCDRSYGYTFGLYVYLNGLGNWQGRNIIASLNVIPGEYDTLLQWPCTMQADIILKDQIRESALHLNKLENTETVDYVKLTKVKGRHDDFHRNQYIHIPHRIVQSRNYLLDDSIYFEVRIRQNIRTSV